MDYFILVKRNNTNDINCHSSKGVYLIMHKICGSGVKFGHPEKNWHGGHQFLFFFQICIIRVHEVKKTRKKKFFNVRLFNVLFVVKNQIIFNNYLNDSCSILSRLRITNKFARL